MRKLIAVLMLALPTIALAQTGDPKPIQDNSFLIEEAYNQEKGVVQHISTFTRLSNGDWAYSFTQEWPVVSQKHQFSYTLQAVRAGQPAGMGDVLLNYRYQLIGSGDTKVAFAPRFSLVLPTGDTRQEYGFGAVGYQFNVPLSVQFSKKLVTHTNAGATFVPRTKNALGERALATGYNVGHSFIWLLHPQFNPMFETLWTGTDRVVASGQTERRHALLLSPGARFAFNFKNGLQIVPGVSVPIGVGPSSGEKGVFLYLSFEHPFTKNHD